MFESILFTQSSILVLVGAIAILTYYLARSIYIKQKALGWFYIILAFFVYRILPNGEYFFAVWVSVLAINEFISHTKFSFFQNILASVIFFPLFLGFIVFILSFKDMFLFLFLGIAFSDIIAYTTGKIYPWRKGFCPVSKNKTLSGFLAQWIFLWVWIDISFQVPIFIAFIAWFLAPVGDMVESYFKRKAGVKDTANYIPWHWWVLDRIDSTILVVNFLMIFLYFVW